MTWTPNAPPPCPLCGTRLVERTEPDDAEEGVTWYAYGCPRCGWCDGGDYDNQRLTVAAAPWTRGVWAELVRTREERDTLAARVRELEAERDRLRKTLAAERGQQAGAASAGWVFDSGYWTRHIGGPLDAAIVSETRDNRWSWGFDSRPEEGTADTALEAMGAVDAVLGRAAGGTP